MADINDIKAGKTVLFYNHPFRVLTYIENCAVMIQLDIEKYNLLEVNISYLLKLNEEKLKPIEDTYGVKHGDPTDEQLQIAKEKKNKIDAILNNIRYDYRILQKKQCIPVFSEYIDKFKISRTTGHKHIRKYLQSGMDVFSLLDQRKCRGKKDIPFFNNNHQGNHNLSDGTKRKKIDPVIEEMQFNEAFGWFQSGTCGSVSKAYFRMIQNHYCTLIYDEDKNVKDITVMEQCDIPSEKRFRRFVQLKINNIPVSEFKKGARKRRNESRIQYGNAQTGVYHPGDCVEIDACELDIIIVAEKDKCQDIGRPVVYFAVDVYSGCIVGFYVGLENNSFLGATSLFKNMFFVEKPIKREDGLKIIPGNFIPNRIRVDQGAEWISNDLRNLQRITQIDVNIVPPATGSLKGLVENAFHVYQENLRSGGKNYGAIYKEYESRHYENASLILEDIKKDVENFVIYFNTQLKKGYTPTKDMVSKGVRAIPCELFHYGIENIGTPIPVTDANKEELLFALCKVCDKKSGYYPKISLKGIEIKGLHYISTETAIIRFLEAVHFKKQKEKFEVRIDPRSVDHIWIKLDTTIYKLSLSSKREQERTYSSLTWFEYDLIYKNRKSDEKAYLPTAQKNKLLLGAQTENIMKKSQKGRELLPANSKKNIREARKSEQQSNRKKEALASNEIYEKQMCIPALETEESDMNEKEILEKELYRKYDDYFI